MGERRVRWPHRPILSVRIGGKHLIGNPTIVFVGTIEAIGLERVAEMATTWNGHLLVARTRPQCLHTSGSGWYVAIPHSASEKHSVLVGLKAQMDLQMTITLTDP